MQIYEFLQKYERGESYSCKPGKHTSGGLQSLRSFRPLPSALPTGPSPYPCPGVDKPPEVCSLAYILITVMLDSFHRHARPDRASLLPCRHPERVYGTFCVNMAPKSAKNGKNAAVSTENRHSEQSDCQHGKVTT